ncbi:MAG TPA: AMP-binding protein [Candidatus Deferrimicrobium sp.]|nr:AMP-binding protein [Candidatus Deferrimicrobium sp.]
MSNKRVLPEKPMGKITIKKSGKEYESVWIYIPTKIANDPSFPFKHNDKVYIQINKKDGKLIVSQREKIFELLDSFGLRNATLPNVLEQKAEENKNKIFAIFGDKKITYKEINERANSIANGLLKLDLGRKQKIAVMLPNIPEFIDSWFGIAKIGGVIVPVNVFLKGDVLQFILSDSDSEHLIIDFSYLDAFEAIKGQVPMISTIIVLNAPTSAKLEPGYLRYEQIIDSNTENPSIKVRDFQPMEIMYTSGTTGRPKGVLYRQYFTMAGLLVGNELKGGGLREDDILYCPLPFFHSFAQFLAIMPSMFVNGTIAIADRFHATDFWERATKCHATAICYVGGMLPMLLKQPEKEIDKTHTVRVAFGGGCPKSIWDEFEKRFNVKIFEGWSLSEAVGFTLNREGTEGGKAGSIGKSIEGFMLKIVDEDGNEMPARKEGEIVAKSSLPISLEYYKQKDEVKKKTDAAGWVHTGDMGYMDEDGYVYFTGRKKDMIRRRGENISAKEVERVADSHPSILETAAFAVPSDIPGDEEVKLVVVLKEGTSLTPVELLDFMKNKAAYFMLPRYIEFKTPEEFAEYKTATERIQKFKFQNEFENPAIQKKTWDGVKEGYSYK